MKRTSALVLAAVFSVTLGVALVRVRSERDRELPIVAESHPALDFVIAKQDALFDLSTEPATPDNRRRIDAVFDEVVDYSALAEASLGTEWAVRTDAEKKELIALLEQLVRKASSRNRLEKMIDFRIDYLGEARANGGAMVVKSKAISRTDRSEEPLEICFEMVPKDGGWRLQDVVAEGQSLVSSYRAQFVRIIKKDGYPALVAKMKKKLAKRDGGTR